MKVNHYRTLDQAVKDRVVQAVNISDMGGTRPKGQLIFKIPTEGSDEVVVTLPPTWINFDLSEYASPEDIGRSVQLRHLLRSGSVVLLTEDSVAALQALPNYEEEYTRVVKMLKNTVNESLSMDNTVEINTGIPSAPPPSETPSNEVEAKVTSNNALSSICMKLLQLDSSQDEVALFEALKLELPGLTADELIEMSSRISNPASLLSNVCGEALGFLNNGEQVDLYAIPTYQKWETERDHRITL